MNARELNEIFEKYGIGHVRLEKPFEDSDEIHAMVVDDNGDYLESSDKWHFSSIGINDNTFGFETKGEISVDELRNIILKKFEKNFESFWREERKFRKEYNKVKGFNDHNSDYDINMFFDYKKNQGNN